MEEIATVNAIFPTESALYMSYMPYVKGGGIFVRSTQIYSLGQIVKLKIHFLKEPEPYSVEGQVVWVTPRGAQGSKPPGAGFQFMGENSRELSQKIETSIAGMLKSAQLTDTM